MSKEAPGTMSKKSEAVNVVVRCRPMLQHETESGYKRVVAMDLSRGTVTLQSLKSINSPREFTYDAVYDWNSKQMDIYDETVRPIVDAVLKGYNGTVFAYGQTGTGKTYTMEGNRSVVEEKGVIPNSFEHIFTHISRAQENERYLVRASYLEIYQDEIRDLLSKDHKQKLELKERPDTGFYVKDLSSFVAKSIREVEHVMNIGNQNRSVGRTDMNEHSSRSHALFVLTVECSQCGADGENHIRVGKLNLVDLAGSEKQSKTGSTGDRFKEATKINLSLSALGNVISALVDSRNSHVPYRDSKLTKLLQDSLGGNAKTVMVANVGPADYNYDETLMTLRFANRAKNIQNKPRINEDPKDALLREYQEEIKKLKEALEKRRSKGGRRKRHRSGGATGEGADSGEDEDTNITSEDDPESNLKVQQAGLEAEKQAILQNGELLAEERQKLLDEVQHRADQLKKELKRRDALSSKIKAMESKLLAGGGSRSILDHTEMQKRELEKQRQEMIKQKRREREIQQQLQAKEESTLEIRDTYTSLQEEVDLKTKKLNKLRSKLAAAHAEIADYKEEQARMREELILTMEDLHRDLKLRTLLVNNFIPPQEVEKVVKHSMFVEDTEEWKLDSQEITFLSNETSGPRQTSTSSNLRPVSTFAKAEATRSGDPRYMAENILRVELDMPNRTTREYEGPVVSQLVQAALDVALQDEEEVVIDASSMVLQSHQRSRRPKISRNRLKAKQQEAEESAQEFPLSRGLVTPAIRFA